MNHYSALFIDLDNTLYDFTANSRAAYRAVFELMDFGRWWHSFDEWFEVYEPNNVHLWTLYGQGLIDKATLNAERYAFPFRQKGIADEPDETGQTLSQRFMHEALRRMPLGTAVKPYAHELLDYLHPRYPLYILSNGFAELQYTKLRSAGIDGYFSGVILSDDIGITKPQRGIFDHALRVAGVAAGEALMIGDHYDVDIVGAHDAGWDSVWYNPDGKGIGAAGYEPTLTIRSLQELTLHL